MSTGFFGRLLSSGDGDEESNYREAPSLLERTRTAVGLQPTAREEAINNLCPSLSFKQRVYGFAICFVIGLVISLTSMLSFSQLLKGNPRPFAIKYTLGNVLSIASTLFLMGPKRQCKRMSAPTRAGAVVVYIGAMVATIVVSCFVHIKPDNVHAMLVLVCIVVQFLAMFWYALSYIPYGRRMFKACCASAMSDG